MTTSYTPQSPIVINGSECTGSDAGTGRTYALPTGSVQNGIQIHLNRTKLHFTTDFTYSGTTITFVGKVYDADEIEITYYKAETYVVTVTGGNNLLVAQRLGIAIQVIDENVGTGDGSETDYDLDNDKILSGSYTLSYAASGSNSFTDLTETTHYTLDKDSGRILLTGSGATAVGSNILYATYWHLADDTPINDDMITTFRSRAEARLRELSGRVWTETSLTEYKDGTRADTYPRTDYPFSATKDFKDYLQLDEFPIQKIDEILFLHRENNSFNEAYNYDGTYTDVTTEADTADETFYPFTNASAEDNAFYIGLDEKFLGVDIRLETDGTDAGSLAITWEYYNGSTWTALSNVTASETDADSFLASGKVTWDKPSAWTKTTVNSGGSLYWARARISTDGFGTLPKAWEAFPDVNGVISSEISPRSVQFTATGRVVFINATIPDGYKNIRIKYTAGVKSTDKDYGLGVDMITLLAALQCVVSITGGSFDDETTFGLGSKNVTVGEVYVNVREVANQLKEEIAEIKRLIGTRIDFGGA